VEAFVISIVTGEDDPSDVDPSDQLSTWGYDDRNIDALADTINKAKWHKVRVTDTEIEKCETIQDVIDLVASKVKAQV
jgi:acyl carrier protein